MQNQTQNPIKLCLNDFKFQFELTFEEEADAGILCDAIINVFQNGSISCLQKEAINQAIADSKASGVKKFFFQGFLKQGGIEATVGLVKPESQLVKAAGPLDFGSLNREQRRKLMKRLKP